MEGKVKFFNRVKGFGFITGDDGKDYFVHYTNLAPQTFIREGDVVSFSSAEGDRGLKAENVTLIKKASEMEGAVPEASSERPQRVAKNDGGDEDGDDKDDGNEEEEKEF